MKSRLNYISHDEGRLHLYRLGRNEWLGVRTEDWQTIRGTEPNHIRQRHDAIEAGIRMRRAGLSDDHRSGRPVKTKGLKDLHRLQREWLIKAW